jgi:uncharacterized repeat protein (TIGR01451 family)
VLLLCLLFSGTAVAQTPPCTKFFVSGGGDVDVSWHNDKNWSPPGVPGPADEACLLEDGDYQVMVTEPVTIAGLQIDANEGSPNVKILATDFTLNGFGYLAGSTKLKVNDGAVLRTDTGSTIEVHSKLVIDGGTVGIDVDLYGHLNYAGTGSLTGGLVTHPGSTIEYEDTGADAHLVIAEGFDNLGQIVFNGSIAMTLEVGYGTVVNTAGGLISTWTGAKLLGIPSELNAQLDNRGLIDVDGSGLRISQDGVQHQNGVDGEIQVADAELEIDLGGVIDVPSNFTNYGTITVADGGSIRVVGSTGPLEVPSNFTNYGTVTVAGGGSVRVVGGTGDASSMSVVNLGFFDLESGGSLSLVDVVFDNPSSGQIRGSGILDISNAAGVNFDGTLSPGFSPGILTIDGSLDLGSNTRVAIEVGGETPGNQLDRLDMTGSLGAGGELDVTLIDLYQPANGERFQILTFDDLDGWFDTTRLPPLMHLLGWNVDVGEHEIGLEVICEGTQLGIEMAADRDPVSVDHEVIYQTRVRNHSWVTATDVTVSTMLPSDLVFRSDLSSPECVLIGSTVECSILSLAPEAGWDLAIGVEPITVGSQSNTGIVAAWECDTNSGDDQALAIIEVVAAEPCDANDDLVIDADDLVPAVNHIFGQRAAGNPDCRLAGGVTADDLAAIIEAGQ